MKKRVLALMCSIVFATAVTACGGSAASEKDSETAVEEATAGETEEKEETETAQEEKTEEVVPEEKTEEVPDDEFTEYLGGLTADGSGWRIDSCLITGQDEIVVPDTIGGYPVKEIGSSAFGMVDAQKIIFPDTVVSIGENVFTGCEALEEIDFGDSLTYITTASFTGCKSLKKISFPEGMTTIDDYLFYDCPELGEIYIPASVTTMPDVMLLDQSTCPNAVIVTPAGSAAEKYAKEYELPYKNS